ncbi:hypothetical protein [Vibrio maritimus]|uniref:hypothetical protein n=1 Tax=Vibrio maritimus TaxID=990268 RepID=UPI001F2F1C95|nr:hypothetical protein [Vibrio maritimus]
MRNVSFPWKLSRNGLITVFSLALPLSVAAEEQSLADIIDFNVQATQYQDETIGVFGVDIAATDSLTVSAEVDTDRYLQFGLSYDWLIERNYFSVYGQYGFDESIDIYDIGFMYGYSVSPSLFVYWDTYYQWRDTTKAYELPDPIDYANHRQEWKNTVGVSYSIHPMVDLGANYNVDVLTSQHGFENGTRNSFDLSATLNTPYVQPYVKYTKGQYRVRPGRPIEDSSNVEFGFYLDF